MTVGISMAYNFQTGNNKIKLLTEYVGVTQKVLFANAVISRKYDIPHNGNSSRESNVRILVFLITKYIIKMQHHYRTQYVREHLRIMLALVTAISRDW
jgi:hypothetical protein